MQRDSTVVRMPCCVRLRHRSRTLQWSTSAPGTGQSPRCWGVDSHRPASFAVDVNQRALRLAAHNARVNNAGNVVVTAPDVMPADLRLDGLYSNPPIKIGKTALRALLLDWLARLGPGTAGWLVVKQAMGADTLHHWLSEAAAPTTRVASKRGYRILRVDLPGERRELLDDAIRAAVDRVTGASWTVLGRLTGGFDEHAFLLRHKEIRAVLKVKHGAWWCAQLQRLETTIDQLRAAGYPTPAVIATGAIDDARSFLLTEHIRGVRPSGVDRHQLDGLLDAIEIQRTVDPAPDRDWSAMVTLFLNGGIAKHHFSPELQDLAHQAIAALPHPVPALPTSGVVHGDFALHNVVLRNGALVGVVDLDNFGRGTPTIDLIALAAAINDPALQRHAIDRAIAMSDVDVVRACLCHRALAILSWASEHAYPNAQERAAQLLALLPDG